MESESLPSFGALVDSLTLAIFVFRRHKLIYQNAAARHLVERLRSKYRTELMVMLRDHLTALAEQPDRRASAVSLMTAERGEPFYLHVMPLGEDGTDVAVSIRELGTELEAFRSRYRLSRREAQVVELVLLGYRNRDIAATLGIAPTTTKKHLTRVFDKVGVDSRTQLVSRLA